jgi:hypothetical protein
MLSGALNCLVNVIMLLTRVSFIVKSSPFNVCVNFTKVGICDLLIKLAKIPISQGQNL